ncbi:MAG TPA: FtsX-like permease family protein [Candidatus Dormibacteraeota bacterium]
MLTRRLRTALAIVAVALGVGLVLGTQLTSSALSDRSQQLARDQFGSADVTVRPLAKQGLTTAMVGAVAALPSVRDTATQLSRQTAADVRGSHSFVLVEGIDVAKEGGFHSLQLSAGRWFTDSETSGVVVAEPYAQQHGLRVGSHLKLVTVTGFDDFTVVGILAPGGLGQLNSGQVAYVSLTTAERNFALGSRVQLIEVHLRPGSSVADFRGQLAKVATQDYYVFDRASITSDQGLLLSGLQPLAIGLGLLSLLVAMLLVANTLAMEIAERRRDIGVLRAAGATSRQVGRIFGLQATVIGLLGGVLGIGLGYALAVIAAGIVGSQSNLGAVPISLVWWQVLVIVVVGALLTRISATVPVGRASRLPPVAALRPGFELEPRGVPMRTTALGLVTLVLGLALIVFGGIAILQAIGSAVLAVAFALLLPLYLGPLLRLTELVVRPFARGETLLASRALARRRTRTALTVGGLGLATAALLALAGLSLSAQTESRDWIGSLFVSHDLVVSPVDQPLRIAGAFTSLPGVAAASPISSFSVRSGPSALPAVAIDPLDYASGGRLALLSGSRQTALAALNGNSVLLPYSLSQQLGAGLGTTLPIGTDQGTVGFQVAGILYHSLPGSNGQEAAVFSQSTAQVRFGVDFFDVLQIVPRGGALDLAALRQSALSYGMDVVTTDQIGSAVDTGLAGITLLLEALGGVGIAVAVIGIVNTMLVSVAEGRHELALLRSIGMARQQLARLVISEAAMLGLTGALVGILLGALALVGLLRATSTPTFQPVVVVPWIALAVVVGGLVVAAVLAALVPARQASRGSIVEALRLEY